MPKKSDRKCLKILPILVKEICKHTIIYNKSCTLNIIISITYFLFSFFITFKINFCYPFFRLNMSSDDEAFDEDAFNDEDLEGKSSVIFLIDSRFSMFTKDYVDDENNHQTRFNIALQVRIFLILVVCGFRYI